MESKINCVNIINKLNFKQNENYNWLESICVVGEHVSKSACVLECIYACVHMCEGIQLNIC